MKTRFADGLAVKMQMLMVQSIEHYATAPLHDYEREQLQAFKAQLEREQPLSKNKHKILRGIHQRTVTAPKPMAVP